MRLSQKEIIEYHKKTEGAFNVYTFDATTKRRYSATIGLDCLGALQEMMNAVANGLLVLVIDNEGEEKVSEWERRNIGKRVPYDFCKPYAVKTYLRGATFRRDW